MAVAAGAVAALCMAVIKGRWVKLIILIRNTTRRAYVHFSSLRMLHGVAPLPARRCAAKRGADSAWEFPAGVAGQLQLGCGDRLTLCE